MKKNLRQARSDAGITQADIAKKTGVTYQMVYQWEKAFAPVARKHWKALASLLRVSESELEEILVQTLLDSCVAAGDSRARPQSACRILPRPHPVRAAYGCAGDHDA